MLINDEIRQQINTFIESPGGKYYLEKLDDIINSKHMLAEGQPELSRDFVQIARGVREAKNELVADGILKSKSSTKRSK